MGLKMLKSDNVVAMGKSEFCRKGYLKSLICMEGNDKVQSDCDMDFDRNAIVEVGNGENAYCLTDAVYLLDGTYCSVTPVVVGDLILLEIASGSIGIMLNGKLQVIEKLGTSWRVRDMTEREIDSAGYSSKITSERYIDRLTSQVRIRFALREVYGSSACDYVANLACLHTVSLDNGCITYSFSEFIDLSDSHFTFTDNTYTKVNKADEEDEADFDIGNTLQALADREQADIDADDIAFFEEEDEDEASYVVACTKDAVPVAV